MAERKFEALLGALPTMSLAELRDIWTRQLRTEPPRISKGLLRLGLAYELQAKQLGGLRKSTARRLVDLASGTAANPVRPGMRLVREWAGTTHVVTIGEDRVIRWNDRNWTSLSAVARAITGTRWSGPAFFGLKQPRRAA